MLDQRCAKIRGHPSNVLKSMLKYGQVLSIEVVWKQPISCFPQVQFINIL